jgi:hypothetical protein
MPAKSNNKKVSGRDCGGASKPSSSTEGVLLHNYLFYKAKMKTSCGGESALRRGDGAGQMHGWPVTTRLHRDRRPFCDAGEPPTFFQPGEPKIHSTRLRESEPTLQRGLIAL